MALGGLFSILIGGGSGGAASASFTTIQPDSGTAPVATGATDTLTLTSANALLTISGNSTMDTITFTVNNASIDHGALTGLGDDDHTQYALLAGRSGGQTLIGGTAASNNLTLQSTSNATRGKILVNTFFAIDEVNDRVGIGTQSPSNRIHGTYTSTATGNETAFNLVCTLNPSASHTGTFTGFSSSVVDAGATNTMATVNCNTLTGTASSGNNITTFRGQNTDIVVSADSGTVSTATAGFFRVNHSGSGVITTAIANNANVNSTGGGTITTAIGIRPQYNFGGSSTITNGRAIDLSFTNTGATVTNWRTFNIVDMGSGSTYYHIYCAGDTQNYIKGNLGMNTLQPAAKIHCDGGNATAVACKFTAGTTTGTTSTDGFDVGVDSSGNAELRQRENLDMIFLTNNTECWRFEQSGALTVPTTVTAGGTTGAQTINKISGTVNFAAAATTLVVTNSLVTANSIIFCEVRTNDATAIIKNVIPAAGSFTIRLNAAATAETSVGFFVIN